MLNIDNLVRHKESTNVISCVYNLLQNNDVVRWSGEKIKIKAPHGLTNIRKIAFRSFTGEQLPFLNQSIPELKCDIILSDNIDVSQAPSSGDYAITVEPLTATITGIKNLVLPKTISYSFDKLNKILTLSKKWEYSVDEDDQVSYNVNKMINYVNDILGSLYPITAQSIHYDKAATQTSQHTIHSLDTINPDNYLITTNHGSAPIIITKDNGMITNYSYYEADTTSASTIKTTKIELPQAFGSLNIDDFIPAIYSNPDNLIQSIFLVAKTGDLYYCASRTLDLNNNWNYTDYYYGYNESTFQAPMACIGTSSYLYDVMITTMPNNLAHEHILTVRAYNTIGYSYYVRSYGYIGYETKAVSCCIDQSNNYLYLVLLCNNNQSTSFVVMRCNLSTLNGMYPAIDPSDRYTTPVEPFSLLFETQSFSYESVISNTITESLMYGGYFANYNAGIDVDDNFVSILGFGIINNTKNTVELKPCYLLTNLDKSADEDYAVVVPVNEDGNNVYKISDIVAWKYKTKTEDIFTFNDPNLKPVLLYRYNYQTAFFMTDFNHYSGYKLDWINNDFINTIINKYNINNSINVFSQIIRNISSTLILNTATSTDGTKHEYEENASLLNSEFNTLNLFIGSNISILDGDNGELLVPELVYKSDTFQGGYYPCLGYFIRIYTEPYVFDIYPNVEFYTFKPSDDTAPEYGGYTHYIPLTTTTKNNDLTNLNYILIFSNEYNDLHLRCSNFPNNDNVVFSINEKCEISFKEMDVSSNNQELNIDLCDNNGEPVSLDILRTLYAKLTLNIDWLG